MKLSRLLIGAVAAVMSFQAFSWGQTGHRVTGAIAEQYLSPAALKAISQLLPYEDLAEASTFADEMRSSPGEFWQKTTVPWHWVTVPEGKTYAQVGAPEEGDAYSGLAYFTKQLTDPASSREQKQVALKFIVHIIGDLHQPMHAGNGKDRGGNQVKVSWFWEDSNLHRVWDTGMIDGENLSYTEFTAKLSRKITPEQAKAWMETDPNVWIAESIKIRDQVYPKSEKLNYEYLFNHLPIVKQRLQMAGVRVAAYLNTLFK
ncbi:S1/P1 nuclease [Paraglaciecola aestuariivivens]